MSTIESDMLGFEERGTVGDASGKPPQDTPGGKSRREWMPPEPEAERQLNTLIAGIGVAMLTTATSEDGLRSRPMATQGRGLERGEIWFFTRDDSGKVFEIEGDHEVNLAYAEPGEQRYVSLSGRAAVLRDPERARALWSPEVETWFPGGPEDPHLALLRVRVHGAEAWDAAGAKMTGLFAPPRPGPRVGEPAAADGQRVMVAY
jgi:general stress protein 26